MDKQEDSNGLLSSVYVLLNIVYGLWTISKGIMFYGLQYNEGFLQRKRLHFILYILYYNIIKNAKFS